MAEDKKFQVLDPGRIGLGRGFRFEAGHVLPGYLGKCATPHGHSYNGRILVSAPRAHADTCGIVADFDVLKEAIQDCIVGPYDHRSLTCSAEALVHQIAQALHDWFQTHTTTQHTGVRRVVPVGIALERVVLYETANCFVEWKRGGYAS